MTALPNDSSQRGNPVQLTWSIVPDGTNYSVTGESGTTTLISRLDAAFNDPNAGTSDLTNRLWFNVVQSALDRWGELSGVQFFYEPNDDGVQWASGNRGVVGVRGDIRIGGDSLLDVSFGGFNFFPSNGDMFLNVTDQKLKNWTSKTETALKFRRMRNLIAHEAGHGLGLRHVSSIISTFIMEPGVGSQFDGPQLDDILGIQSQYGDRYEKAFGFTGNDTLQTAVDLGKLNLNSGIVIGEDGDSGPQVGSDAKDFVSIDDVTDTDFYTVTLANAGMLKVKLYPVGGTYTVGTNISNIESFNAELLSDLQLAIYDSQGQLLLDVNNNGLGDLEEINNFPMPAGQFFIRVTGTGNDGSTHPVQLYELAVGATSN